MTSATQATATVEPDTTRPTPVATYDADIAYNSDRTYDGQTVGRPTITQEVESTHG